MWFQESNGVLLGSPRHHDTSSRSDGDSSCEPPNDENRPDVTRLKERRLQEFYRDQLLSNGQQEDLTDLSFKQPLLLEKIQRYSEQPFNFPNKLHHISRIMGVDSYQHLLEPAKKNHCSPYPTEVNPLHGLKTLASLLEDNSNSSGPTDIQRRKSLSCSDLIETSRNDSNNNEGSMDASSKCEECGKGFEGSAQLQQHRQSQECLTCAVCGKRFPQRSLWEAHQRLHEEHACTHCNKSFVTRASLKVGTDCIFKHLPGLLYLNYLHNRTEI